MIIIDRFIDLYSARRYAFAAAKGAVIPEVDAARTPLTAAMAEYALDFEMAERKGCLHEFNVQERLDSVRRVPAAMFSAWRSIAGLLILCGLLVTLSKLQSAVGPLGHAFQQLSDQQQGKPSSTQPNAVGSEKEEVSQIQGTMSAVASSAQQAFRLSGRFILSAALISLLALFLQNLASASVTKFASWAERAYRLALPEQISIAEAAIAFKENAKALGDLTRSFNDVATSLQSVQNFSATMEDARDTISKALEAMPGHIEASMGMVTKDMVRSLESAIKDEVEAIKKILAIYGAQEFRIGEIRQEVLAVRGFSEKVAQSALVLEGVPKQLGAISNSLKEHAAATLRLDSTAKHIESAVKALPSAELLSSAKALTEAGTQIGQAHTQAVEAINVLQKKTSTIGRRDDDIRKRLDEIAKVAQDSIRDLNELKTELVTDQKATANRLEALVGEAISRVAALAGKDDIISLAQQVGKVDMRVESFLGRLRLRQSSGEPIIDPLRPHFTDAVNAATPHPDSAGTTLDRTNVDRES